MANKARRLLILLGKMLPFILCFIIMLSYVENLYALVSERYIHFMDYSILDTPLSFAIGDVFEYDLLIVFITLIVSIAIEACRWNLWATFYLLANLFEKSYFDFELEPTQIYIIIAVNLAASGFFVYKGVKILLKSRLSV